ncbi:MAG: hypothetical protein H7330_08915 [Hymenobacteraceae bacterium]|nr:hypothetical protein [Hymenobacteraceae bacterium]
MHKIGTRTGLLAVALLTTLAARAQLDNRAFLTPLAADSGQARQLRVRAELFFFNKDNEYFHKIADGYTLFGVTARPQLTWQPNARVKLAAGVFFRQDFGNQLGPNGGSRLRQIRPALTAVVQGDSWRFLFGSLDGHLHHGLAEPLYDFERVMLQRPEEGIQLTGETGRLRYDAWVNWERMQYARDSAQEAVSGGFSGLIDLVGGHRYKKTLAPGAALGADDPFTTVKNQHFSDPSLNTYSRHTFGLRVPIQFTGRHIGGQIDTIDRPLQTYFVGATGLRAVWRWDSASFIHGLRLEALATGFLDYSFTPRLPFPSGKGLYLNAGLETKLNTIWVSYWRGDGFASPGLGGVLYSSLGTTVKNPGYRERQRELLIVRFTHDFRLWQTGHLTSRAEPYYDLRNKRFEFNLGLYLTGLLDGRLR